MGDFPASTFSIRIAKPMDSDAVDALLVASYSSLLTSSYDSDLLTRALPHITKANPTLLACGTYYVAETEVGGLVGCGGWTPQMPGGGDITEGDAHIRHFATHPEYTRQEIGASILTRCINDARSFGIRRLHCISTLNAERFYQAVGFNTVGPIDVQLERGIIFPAVLMSSEIA
jgi:N-acetylglutamate synthase-like GNAT family acetyltransferase